MTDELRKFRSLAREKRNEVADELRRDLPFVLLCLERDRSAGWTDDLRKTLGDPVAIRELLAFWILPPTLATDRLLSETSEGEWGLFFFPERPDPLPLPPIPLVPSRRQKSDELLESTGAQAAIIAEPDDNNWLIAFPGDNGEEEHPVKTPKNRPRRCG